MSKRPSDKDLKETEKALDKLFDKYKDAADPDSLTADGLMALCTDLKVDPNGPSLLLLSHAVKAERMLHFSRVQFRELRLLGVKTLSDLKTAIAALSAAAVASPAAFKALYEFTFAFALDKSKGERVLCIETAIALWGILFALPGQSSSFFDSFSVFLEAKKIGRSINRDCWNQFLIFSQTIKRDFSNYDPELAWPTLLDEFVESQRGGPA